MATLTKIIQAFQKGEPIVVYDGQNEMEGDIILAAEHATPEMINWISMYARGLICVAIDRRIATRLNLNLMPKKNKGQHMCSFLESVDAIANTTTGISAFDRAKTIQLLASPTATSQDFCSPGHVFPCLANEAGLTARQGHTEATIYLCELARLRPAGVICEILDDDGHMKNFLALKQFARKWDLSMISIEELVEHHLTMEIS